MLGKISTPVLFAFLMYHGYKYYGKWKFESSLDEYKAKLEIHKKTLKPKFESKIVKASDEVYVATWYALGNSIMIIGKTGIIIIDTTESLSAAKIIYDEFRKITDKPIKGIIYTHNHFDHLLGTESFLANETNRDDVEIWAHHTLTEIYFHNINVVGQAHYYRAMHQFGGFLPDTQKNEGLKLKINVKITNTIYPNRFLYKSQQDINLAGITLRLMHTPGETDDHINIFWPEKNILFTADNLYEAFPNLYAIRGTPFRSLNQWKNSLDVIRNLRAEILVPSHFAPIHGAENIYNRLTDYRDAVQLVHDQTVRFMNQGFHPDEIAERIHLPKSLKDQPYLQEIYGTVKWSSKGLFTGYMGWFSGGIVDLNPHTPYEQAQRLVELSGGIDKIILEAQNSLDNGDAQWSLRLSSAALRVDSTNQIAKEIKAKSLFDMAESQTSFNGINYYVTCAYVTLGKFEIKTNVEARLYAVRYSKIKDLFFMMSLKFKSEECYHMDKVVLFVFPDTKERVMFHARNGLMDLSGNYQRKEDVKISVNSVVWREILSGESSGLLSVVTSEVVVEPGIGYLREFMNCIDST